MKLEELKNKTNRFKYLSRYDTRLELLENMNVLRNLWSYHFYNGVYENLTQRDFNIVKQQFLDAGIISLYLTEKRNSDVFLWSYNRITAVLLSDNKDVHKLFAKTTNEIITQTKNNEGAVLSAFQNSLIGNSSELQNDINNILSPLEPRTGDEVFFYGLIANYFQAIQDQNQSEVLSTINQFLESPRRKNRYSGKIIDDFIARPEAAFVKLAWIKGLNIEIDHPLIPMNLMPIKPNTEYIDTHTLLIELAN